MALSAPGHGFLYDGTNWTTIDPPWWDALLGGTVTGVSGNNVVGTAARSDYKSLGFLYDGSNYTPILPPGSDGANIFGVSDNIVIGSYGDAAGTHGFVYIIPEPSTAALLGVGLISAFAYLYRRRRTLH